MPSRTGPAELPEAGTPLVVTIERAAVHLGVPAERVAQVAATLDVWVGSTPSSNPFGDFESWNAASADQGAGRVVRCHRGAGS
jgi:hypothetical protein